MDVQKVLAIFDSYLENGWIDNYNSLSKAEQDYLYNLVELNDRYSSKKTLEALPIFGFVLRIDGSPIAIYNSHFEALKNSKFFLNTTITVMTIN